MPERLPGNLQALADKDAREPADHRQRQRNTRYATPHDTQWDHQYRCCRTYARRHGLAGRLRRGFYALGLGLRHQRIQIDQPGRQRLG